MPSSKCIDWFQVSSPVIAIAASPSGHYFATSHLGFNGVRLWANKQFAVPVFLKSISDAPVMHDIKGSFDFTEDDEKKDEMDSTEVEWDTIKVPEQLHKDLVTLSKGPRSKWPQLVNLEEERAGSVVPKQQGTAEDKVPFFLPTLPGIEPKFAPYEDPNKIEAPKSRIINLGALRPKTEFITILTQAHDTKDYSKITEKANSMALAALDFEIRSLSMENDCLELRMVLKWLYHILESKTHFDLTEAILNIFLREYSSLIKYNPELLNQVKTISSLHKKAYKQLRTLHNYNICLIQYFSGEK